MLFFFSPVKPYAEQSSSEDLLGSDTMGSGTPPKASFSKRRNETEVSSQKDPGHGGGEKVVKAAPGGHTSGADDTREKNLVGVDGEGHLESGPKPDTLLETHKVPESDRQLPPSGGRRPSPPTASIQPEVLNTLSAALESAWIIDEHRALMGAVIEKIQSAERGLNEACVRLITGFEVCFKGFRRVS